METNDAAFRQPSSNEEDEKASRCRLIICLNSQPHGVRRMVKLRHLARTCKSQVGHSPEGLKKETWSVASAAEGRSDLPGKDVSVVMPDSLYPLGKFGPGCKIRGLGFDHGFLTAR